MLTYDPDIFPVTVYNIYTMRRCEAAVSLRSRMIIARRWERSPVSRKMFIVPPCPNTPHQLLCNKKRDRWLGFVD
jgi:hypothetical protein